VIVAATFRSSVEVVKYGSKTNARDILATITGSRYNPCKSYLWYLHPNSLPAGYRHTVLQAIAEGVCGVLQDQEKR